MKKAFLSIIILFSIFSTVFTQEKSYSLSKNSVISLITMEPSSEADNYYGNSAIRIYDEENNIDELFNLGWYDSNQRLSFMIHTRFIDAIEKDNLFYKRNWTEQELNLSIEEKRKIFEFLILSFDGSYYGYDQNLTKENSSIKIFSLLKLILSDRIEYDFSSSTARQILNNKYISQSQTILNNIFYGSKTDLPLSINNNCYTPEYLKSIISNSKIKQINKDSINLMANERSVVNSYPQNSSFFNELFVQIFLAAITFIILIVTIIQFIFHIKKIPHPAFSLLIKSLDILLFTTAGCCGIIIILNNFFSTELLYHYNFNFTWLFPFNTFISLLILKSNKNLFLTIYFIISFVCLFIPFACIKIWPQYIGITNSIFITILAIRYAYQIFEFIPLKTKKPALSKEPVNSEISE